MFCQGLFRAKEYSVKKEKIKDCVLSRIRTPYYHYHQTDKKSKTKV